MALFKFGEDSKIALPQVNQDEIVFVSKMIELGNIPTCNNMEGFEQYIRFNNLQLNYEEKINASYIFDTVKCFIVGIKKDIIFNNAIGNFEYITENKKYNIGLSCECRIEVKDINCFLDKVLKKYQARFDDNYFYYELKESIRSFSQNIFSKVVKKLIEENAPKIIDETINLDDFLINIKNLMNQEIEIYGYKYFSINLINLVVL